MDLKGMGNIEVLKSFLSLHYQIFNFYEQELKEDPRANEYKLILKDIVKNTKAGNRIEEIYKVLFQEAQSRGLKEMFFARKLIYTEKFQSWQNQMLRTPTYIREIEATNYLGNYDISYADDEVIGFDYPVRSACKVLAEKGYITYWSSANKEDYLNRKGQVMQNKSVAYILIDSKNLTEDLKRQLFLNGNFNFWGAAIGHEENGKYYGIWTEIPSQDTLCEEVSRELLFKALSLPLLEKEKDYKITV